MTAHVSRRGLLKLGTVAAVAPWLPVAALKATEASATESSAAANAVVVPRPVNPFRLEQASLTNGLFTQKRQYVLDFARGYDENRLLQVFRANAGLPTLGAVAPGGWEGLDGEANGNLRGHFTGHFMSMLSQAYASTGKPVFRTKLTTMIQALHECRDALRREPTLVSTQGRTGTAIELVRGSSLYLQLPAGVTTGLTSMTIAVWVRPAAAANWARILDFGNDRQTYMFLAQRDGQGNPRFAITRNWGGGEQVVSGTTPLPVGQWSHVALTLTGTTATLFVNGVQVGQNTAMSLRPADLGALANCWIGRSQYDDPLFSGAIDDVNIWSSALTAAQVRELLTARAADTSAGRGDVTALACDDTSGVLVRDSSGKERHATLRRSWGLPSHPGFLAAYPETQFITLESMTKSDYTVVWAPYYTAHKILKGLLDAYTATEDPRALDLASGMCDWMHFRLSRLTDAVRQRMWNLFSSGEFGGIVEAILETYGHTGKPEHLQLAKLFDLNSLIDNCAAGKDVLAGLHANQHIPIFTGAVQMYEKTGEQRYWDAARNFWNMVVPQRMFSIGGTSDREFWGAAGAIASTLGNDNAETCCVYNMLKLTRSLFFHRQDPAYMDYYERVLFNQVLGAKQDQHDAEMPLMTYFIGLQPGAVRDFTPKAGTTCCEGTGMESATKYQDSAYFHSSEQNALYVNLYMPSKVRWAAKDITITQRTTFPFEQRSTLRFEGGGGTFDLKLRVPAWVGAGVSVRVNGERLQQTVTPGSYLTIGRRWRNGDKVEIVLPFTLRAERTPDDPTVQCLMYGPVNLVARDSRTTLLPVSLYGGVALSGDLSRALTPIEGRPLHFRLGELELAPFFEGTTDPFHTYVRRSEPQIVFGTVDTGVPNRARAGGGATFLDEVFAGAPFASNAAFRKRVRTVADEWVTAGLLTAAERTQIAQAAATASLPR